MIDFNPAAVTPYNIAYLQELVRNGPTTYPGARYVVRDTGERIDLRYNKRADAFLQYGWIVERHLKDGEYVYVLPLQFVLGAHDFSASFYSIVNHLSIR
jgi:DNA-directed RNA polymerase beta' subunit